MWWVECGANLPNGGFVRNVVVKENEVNQFRFKHNNCGVYATIYKYDTPKQDGNILGNFYLDLDSDDQNLVVEDAISAIRYIYRSYGIEYEQLEIYFSGQKGIHIIVPSISLGVIPSKNLNKVYRLMAEDIKSYTKHGTIDLKIYDNRRLFRLPNSKHPKTGLYKVPLTYQELTTLSASEIIELAKLPRAGIKPKIKFIPIASLIYQGYTKRVSLKQTKVYNGPFKVLDYTPPCIESLIEGPVVKGQRNNSTAALASFYNQQGLDKEETYSKLVQWNNEHCDPLIPLSELETTLESVYKGKYKMGCSWLSTVSNCDKENCKLYKRRR
jgi:hypothetical protein